MSGASRDRVAFLSLASSSRIAQLVIYLFWVSWLVSPALAHTQNGTLGAPASATDHYEVTCFNDGSGEPQSLSVEIRDSSPGALPQVSAHVQRNDTLSTTSDDTVADGQTGPEIHVNEGAGIYRVLVTKTGSGTKFYSVSFHCNVGLNGTGAHAGSVISVLQSQ